MLKQRTEVLGRTMAYVDVGSGDPLVFLHGNPTSSFLWRDVIAELCDEYRCVAPDLIGMGDSDPVPDPGPGSYRFVEHRRYLDDLLDQLDLGDEVTFVLHDWGGALGFDWARRNPGRVVGIAYMETIVCPIETSDWPEASRGIFEGFRSDAGESLVIEKNYFVERVLPASIMRDLTDAEMNEYRRPYAEAGESRRPTLAWPREIPIDGRPADVTEIVGEYSRWMADSDLPKLFINADPGAILVGRQRELCRGWPNQIEVTVPGIHFIQEDSGAEIGQAIRRWRSDL